LRVTRVYSRMPASLIRTQRSVVCEKLNLFPTTPCPSNRSLDENSMPSTNGRSGAWNVAGPWGTDVAAELCPSGVVFAGSCPAGARRFTTHQRQTQRHEHH